MSNLEAVNRTICAMEASGVLEDVDEALVEAVRSLAFAVDADPSNASLWQQYGARLNDLRSLKDGGSDSFDILMASLQAPIRDEPQP